MIDEHRIQRLSAISLPFEDGPHPWHEANRRAIEAAWQEEIARRPFLFNGPVVMHFSPVLRNGVLSARSRMADYACLTHWLAKGGLPPVAADDACHFFGSPVLISRDGAIMMVRMGPRTANAGQLYCPCGSLDAADVADGRVDIDANMAREVAEETGLDLSAARREEDVHVYRNGGIYTCFRRHFFDLTAAEITHEVRRHIAGQENPEIVDILGIMAADRLDDAMPDYMRAFVTHHFA